MRISKSKVLSSHLLHKFITFGITRPTNTKTFMVISVSAFEFYRLIVPHLEMRRSEFFSLFFGGLSLTWG